MTKDLTTGKPSSVLWRFTVPMFASVVFQQLYNIADSVIAGKFAGEDALAAVGASYPITMIFMAIAMGCNIGCSVVIAQLFGAKDYGKMKTAVTTTLLSALFLSALLTVGGIWGAGGMMRLLNTPENILKDGGLYLKIYIGGFVFLFLYNVATGIFTALGDSRTPLYFLIGSSLGNIFLDILFVKSFGWGVAGVAWATFLAQGVACILALITIWRKLAAIEISERAEWFSLRMLGKISRVAIPSILQQSFISVGNLLVQGLINSFGSSVIAGYSAAIKLNTFCITSLSTIGNSMSNFTAQNMGAGRTERVKKGFRSGLVMSMAVAALFFCSFFFFGEGLLLLFMDGDSTKALETGREFLRIAAPFYFVVAVKLLADGVLRGASAMTAFMISTFADLILRVALSFIFAAFMGTTGIWCSWPVGWIIGTIVSYMFYRTGRWNSLGRFDKAKKENKKKN